MRVFGLFLISLFLRAPWPVKILISLPLLPIVIAVMVVRFRRQMKHESPVMRMSPEDLSERLVLQTAEIDPSRKETGAFTSRVETFADAQNWEALANLVTRCDQARMAAKDDTRLAPLAIEALWTSIAPQDADDCLPQDPDALPDSVLDPFLEAADDDPDSYAPTALAAGLAMNLGWARRGGAWAQLTEDDAMAAMQALFDTAGGLLAEFDPEEANSPLLAGLAYEHLAGTGTDLAALKRAFSLRMRLDPDDPDALAQHGWFLLPRWYGDYEVLDDTARRRYADTHKRRGAADYAHVYARAIPADEGAMMMVDMQLYRDGLIDMIDHSRDPDATVNTILNTLYEVSQPRMFLGGGREPKEFRERRAQFRTIFDDIARARLGRVLPHRWDDGFETALYSVAETYQDQILAGETVHIGDQKAA